MADFTDQFGRPTKISTVSDLILLPTEEKKPTATFTPAKNLPTITKVNLTSSKPHVVVAKG